ncbi:MULTISPECIES: class II fructose-bisphosphate aldolase [Streptomyces]|uniref:Class II fructose-bisphosphate aldolase family protein n=1 Tax=Streptomyces caniscabiei TaxID=2746961 RepID=A0ABU4MUQ4_9ACTN|nr:MULTISPECIES: class II fructose-bisphosphate aldolase [Streptomyces]MBE4741088.1 class II fructose-bisphosphate aldolase family protein [Streptomyces caniscabiei]MBE4760437.1 class II fructose-bisphosphate aldolase family protein [Streptomyces caniscabiei]MBE4774397.1 class II fructose-bisphosphate aldolase family protein [Streptomyces caniscabiei]MBE4789380.1 class II fructose-bisphosphate aldolase family protein [Streptomyces caniscabiei]MBE4798479.1 class II fructose-bisphosphate aldolas
MPLTTTGALITEAAAARSAVAAFNVITLEHVEAIVAGAESAAAPVVLQVSENAVGYHDGDLLPLARAASAAAERAAVPVALHLDHIRDDDLLRRAADAGFSSVMYDASRLPYLDNLAATHAAVQWAHSQGLWIEAELGQVGGKDGAPVLDAHAPGARTDPEEARAFVADSGVDALAVAIGSSHAMTTRTAALDHVLLKRLAAALDVPLVLHGSSGVPDDELRAAVAGGIAKVNIGTALNIALTGAVRDHLAARPDAVDPRTYLAAGRTAMAGTVARLIGVLRTEEPLPPT